jgi:ketosteroid isomerase-like protein
MDGMPTGIDLTDLPANVRRYLDAHRDKDAAAAIATFSPDAVVVDDGKTYTGLEQIHEWLGRSASEYTYTIELTAAAQFDDLNFEAVNHLDGNFPGGTVDLRYRFTLDSAGGVARLVIQP